MATAINKLDPVRSNPDGRTDGQLDTQNTNAMTIVKARKKKNMKPVQSGPAQTGGRTDGQLKNLIQKITRSSFFSLQRFSAPSQLYVSCPVPETDDTMQPGLVQCRCTDRPRII